MSSPLRADVYVAPAIPFKDGKGREHLWSPIPCTLIHGAKEAVLVDTPITTAQTTALADWISAIIPHKRLTTIYITHGHGDHFFGIPTLLNRFPGAKVVATKGTVEHMKHTLQPKAYSSTWEVQFPGQIDAPQQLAEPLTSNEFFLEGHSLRALEVGHSDTYDTTVLWVPDIKLAVCGDVVYGDVHQFLGEANTKEKRGQWIAALETVQALKPELVVPGHKREGEIDGAFHLESTKLYLQRFGEIIESGKATSPKSLFNAMMEQYGNRVNPGALLAGCVAAFPRTKTQKL